MVLLLECCHAAVVFCLHLRAKAGICRQIHVELERQKDSFQLDVQEKENLVDPGKSSVRSQKSRQQGTFEANDETGKTPLGSGSKAFSASGFGFDLVNPSVTILLFEHCNEVK